MMCRLPVTCPSLARTSARACASEVPALSALALAVFLGLAHGRAPIASPEVPWWAVALGFLVAEACVVHLQFQRSAHSFSLADIPFVFALVFASGDAFVLGALIGT